MHREMGVHHSFLPLSSRFSLVQMMINRPNRVIEHQRYFQAPSQTPLWLKGPRDKVYAFFAFSMIGVGLTGALYGTYK